MKELFLVCAVGAVLAFGFFVVKRLDAYLEKNRGKAEEATVSRLFVAFENPMILEALVPVFERFSKEYPSCEIRLFCGSAQEINDKINENKVDLGLVQEEHIFDEESVSYLRLSLEKEALFCDNVGLPIQPLGEARVSTVVMWKRESKKNYIQSFVDLLSGLPVKE